MTIGTSTTIGMALKSRKKPIAKGSFQVPRFSAANSPSGIPIRYVSPNVIRPMRAETQMRSSSRSTTVRCGLRNRYESPRSPREIRPQV